MPGPRPSLIVLVALVGTACALLPESPYRQALPADATEIREHRSGGVDFTYLLRARLDEAGFRAYVAGLGLEPGPGPADREAAPAPHPDDPDWWSPIRSGAGTHERRSDGDIIRAKYENGFLYLSVVHL